MRITISNILKHCIAISAFCFIASKSPRVYKTSVVTDNFHHSRYDDTTLTVDNSSILMPYNRFIDPAGTVMRFGNPVLENHSLDCAVIQEQNIFVVEVTVSFRL